MFITRVTCNPAVPHAWERPATVVERKKAEPEVVYRKKAEKHLK